jgi:hypothetical protein
MDAYDGGAGSSVVWRNSDSDVLARCRFSCAVNTVDVRVRI